jgi:serine protease inhibitor
MVDTMHKSEMMWYYEDDSVQVLDLPYQSHNWFARIVLPKKSIAQKGNQY